ncbi:hypothetical protein [Tenggerimyces flavus]|uniref:VTT domain-containing protein n=1 Tax=Tenggerimyces flavus TaxID=1708749 RepID=A0ABV7YHH2_9ACTN|nr:hypothetical protein [Tenggerimyces flavus]MBM7784018.1 hypothetical protein [Tenggerimyces flavus]
MSLFSLGLLLGGVVSALVLFLLSGLGSFVPLTWRHVAVLAIAVVGALRDAGVVRFWLPQNTRQVPQDVLQRHLWRGSLQFGFELGTGVRTYVSATAPYVVALALLLSSPSVWVAVVTGLGFGLGRAVTLVSRYAAADQLRWDGWVSRVLPTLKIVVCLAIGALLALSWFS